MPVSHVFLPTRAHIEEAKARLIREREAEAVCEEDNHTMNDRTNERTATYLSEEVYRTLNLSNTVHSHVKRLFILQYEDIVKYMRLIRPLTETNDGVLSMFYKRQYIIEPNLVADFFTFARDTYSIKDVNGNLLGYFKRKKRIFGGGEFWIEATDGTRQGEIRRSGNKYDVYDVQNRLRATIRKAPTKKKGGRRFRLGLIIILSGIPMMLLALVGLKIGVEGLFTVGFFGGIVLSVFGLIYIAFMAATGKLERPKWWIEDPEGRQLAEGNDFWIDRHLKIQAPNGGVIARIKGPGISIKHSCRIDISRKGFEPLLILSYAVLMIWLAKAHARSV